MENGSNVPIQNHIKFIIQIITDKGQERKYKRVPGVCEK